VSYSLQRTRAGYGWSFATSSLHALGSRILNPRRQLASRGWFLAVMLVMAAASIALRRDATPDVSWLITMCVRILNGERAYVDILETTPPVPMLLYMPGTLAAKYVGGAPETWTYAFAYACALGSLSLAARILPARFSDGGSPAWLVLAPIAAVLFLFPKDAFAQREYFAAAWAAPITAVFIRHADSRSWPPLTDRVLAAILGGLMVAVKPPLFALPGVLVGLYCWGRTRSLSFILPSGLLAAAVIGLAVTAASLAAFPDYLRNMLDIMRDVYVPIRGPASWFVHDGGCVGVLTCLAITAALSFRSGAPAATISAMVATGFLAAYFIQGKYFWYHIYPAAPFGAAAACVVIYRHARRLGQASLQLRVAAAGAYGLAVCIIAVLFARGFADGRPVMHNLTWARALAHPRALAVSPQEDTSFPLAREIGAVWVGHAHSQWIADYTGFALGSAALTPQQSKRYLSYHRSDLEAILREIKDKRPQIIIEDTRPSFSWLVPELNAMQPGFLDGYRVIAEENVIRVLGRKSPASLDSAARPPSDEVHGAGP
jgi:hypothetical protein